MKVNSVHEMPAGGSDARPQGTGPQPDATTGTTRRDIVVIGASAGGVEALRALVAALPPLLPASVFVVLHISPHSPSLLPDILAHVSPLPVVPASDGAPFRRGQVHVAVADRHLLVEHDRMRTPRGPRENFARPAVDVLFRSAAYAFGPRVIGVVLSGNLADGSAGLWAVKDRGGVALVQAPEEAPYPSMPQSALRQVTIDRVVSIRQMAAAIAEYTREAVTPAAPPRGGPMEVEVDIARGGDALRRGSIDIGTIVPMTCPECHGSLSRIDDGPIARYRCHTGHAFSQQALLAQIDEEIDRGLWKTLRAIDERILLLRHLEQQARAAGDAAGVAFCAAEMRASGQRTGRVRTMLRDAPPADTETVAHAGEHVEE